MGHPRACARGQWKRASKNDTQTRRDSRVKRPIGHQRTHQPRQPHGCAGTAVGQGIDVVPGPVRSMRVQVHEGVEAAPAARYCLALPLLHHLHTCAEPSFSASCPPRSRAPHTQGQAHNVRAMTCRCIPGTHLAQVRTWTRGVHGPGLTLGGWCSKKMWLAGGLESPNHRHAANSTTRTPSAGTRPDATLPCRASRRVAV